jgi:hypothetical protein
MATAGRRACAMEVFVPGPWSLEIELVALWMEWKLPALDGVAVCMQRLSGVERIFSSCVRPSSSSAHTMYSDRWVSDA